MTRLVAAFLLILVDSLALFSQQTSHLFPQFVDGRFPDGSRYTSTITTVVWGSNEPGTCKLDLYGMTANLEGMGQGSSYAIQIPTSGFVARTTGSDSFQSGYALLTCNKSVLANVLYTYYSPTGAKLGEATVFSSDQFSEAKMVVDERDGARLGVALANTTDAQHYYDLTFTDSSGTKSGGFLIPARQSVARFIDDWIPLQPSAVGVLTIRSLDSSSFSAIGLRYTGSVFTTIAPNVLPRTTLGSNTMMFKFTGAVQRFTVPSDITHMDVELWGAGGGGGGLYQAGGGGGASYVRTPAGTYVLAGGGGGGGAGSSAVPPTNFGGGGGGGSGEFKSFSLDVALGETYEIIVGGAGVGGVPYTSAGAGGYGGDFPGSNGQYLASGQNNSGLGGRGGGLPTRTNTGGPGGDGIGMMFSLAVGSNVPYPIPGGPGGGGSEGNTFNGKGGNNGSGYLGGAGAENVKASYGTGAGSGGAGGTYSQSPPTPGISGSNGLVVITIR
jgi:hypothetical protein